MNTKKAFWSVVLAGMAVLTAGLLLGGGWLLTRSCYGYGPGMMRSFGVPFGMHTFGGGILTLLFWGAIIGGGVLLVTGLRGRNATPANRDKSPLEILKRRYARGEIDHDEFERIKESLLS
jgi:putative membrane protein